MPSMQARRTLTECRRDRRSRNWGRTGDAAGRQDMRPSRSGTERGAANQALKTQWGMACVFQAGALLSSMNAADTSAVALLERDRSFEGDVRSRRRGLRPVGLI